jgi:GNAT superfamily N-acetyltransferase
VLATLLTLREILWPSSYRLCLFGLTPATAHEMLPPPEALEAHIASASEVQALQADGWLELDCAQRLARGDRCLVQRWDGRIAGLGWLATRPKVKLGPGIPLQLPTDAGYTYRSWTHPEFRGHGLQARRALAFLRLVQQEGRGRLMLFAQQTKFDSRKGVRKAGYERIGWIDVRERGGVASWRLRISDPAWSAVVPQSGERGQCAVEEDVPDAPRQRA